MKKNYIKSLSLGLATVLTVSIFSPVYAYDLDASGNSVEEIEYQSSEDEDFNTDEVSVFAEIGSLYKVTIPKTIVLSGITKKASYLVKVAGDIAGYEIVNVVPEESVTLKSANKADQTGTISQDKTSWKVADFDTDANGTVEASALDAGKWSGTFNFNISLDTDVKELVLDDIVLPNVDTWDETETIKSY